ncbi:RNA polymerase sigma factor [Methylophilus luteus]|uniref:RNA polymerase sigma factor n=1 Tax=Methylophilus luteus TaxID=640108 RepID=A0ABW3F5X1_9PROT
MSFLSKADHDSYWCNLSLKWVYTDLFRSIYGQTRNFHLANDVLHDAIVKFAVKNSLRQIDEPQAYMRGIVKNTIVDYYRDAAHYVDMELSGANQDLLDAEHELSYQHSPEKIADLKQRMLALQNIIDCLPPKCRQVFWMHRIEGKLQTDVATELNISLNMVERHMIRALVDISLAKDFLLNDK